VTAPESPELRPARPLRRAGGASGSSDLPSGGEFEELRDLLLAAIDHLIALEDDVRDLTAAVERLASARPARPLRAASRIDTSPD